MELKAKNGVIEIDTKNRPLYKVNVNVNTQVDVNDNVSTETKVASQRQYCPSMLSTENCY